MRLLRQTSLTGTSEMLLGSGVCELRRVVKTRLNGVYNFQTNLTIRPCQNGYLAATLSSSIEIHHIISSFLPLSSILSTLANRVGSVLDAVGHALQGILGKESARGSSKGG